MSEPDAPTAARSAFEEWRRGVAANLFDGDAFLERLLRRHLGARAGRASARLRTVAASAGPELDDWVATCGRDENLPRLAPCDAFGAAAQEVVFHPSYDQVGRVFWASGVLAILAQPGNEVLAGAIAYLLDQHGEAGHACPVACTAGAIKLLQRLGTEPQRQRYLPRLLNPDYDERLHAAQFVTEVQGGSDVGLNSCRAVPDPDRPGWYRISGEKWFCSVADAGLFVVSARLADAPEGTKGLGLFLIPRRIDGLPNGFRLRRLKDKLGTRSMATGEIEFEDALGEAIGPSDQGFRNLVGIVLDTSRVHNALAACGLMRRSEVEALEFARSRNAFGQRILDFPSVQETLSQMRLCTMTGLASTFRILSWSDRLDTSSGDEALRAARRIAVMINKYWTAIAATRCTHDGIELLGGNGTIEDFSVLPRLYRDAIVLESWEGTHNALCAQVLRDFAVRGLHEPWLAESRREIESLRDPQLEGVAATARSLVDDVAGRIQRLLASDQRSAGAHIRSVVDRMCRSSDWLALACQLQWERAESLETDTADALRLYQLTVLERTDPQDSPELFELHRRFCGAAGRPAPEG